MFKLQFNSFAEFIAMGGHAEYVWQCYSVVIVSLVFYFYHSKNKISKQKQDLKKLYRQLELDGDSTQND
jgi:heme exporter protein CcmD